MIQPRLDFYPIYILDTCCVMELDNAHQVLKGQDPPPPRYTDDERAAIWEGLERLAEDGRLRIIRFVREELASRYPAILPRLDSLPNTQCNITNRMRRVYQELIGRHPKIIEGWPRDPAHDDADPWIIAFAKTSGFTVVTEEVSAEQSSRKKRKKGIPIPDLCRNEGIRCVALRELAGSEGWLSSGLGSAN